MILGLFLSNIALVILHQISSPAAATTTTYDIVQYGAKSDGCTDSSYALSHAWSDACYKNSSDSSTVYVPPGTFLLSSVVFKGPCNCHVTFQMDGTLVAPSGFGPNLDYWVLFYDVGGVTIHGGPLGDGAYHLDGNGAHLWDCKKHGGQCPIGRTTLVIMHSKRVSISKLRLVNSQLFQLAVVESKSVSIRDVSIKAPEDSPNTDGIHIEKSHNVRVYNVEISTGDDCISIGPGTKNVSITNVNAGPCHGISIGSLGRSYDEQGVENVVVNHATLAQTQNGVRLKTYSLETKGYAKNIVFADIQMNNVFNPILIDQQYCPHGECPESQGSGAQLSGITYQDIYGTSTSQVVVKISCSNSNPCTYIKFTNINLKYVNDEPAETVCFNAVSTTMDSVEPKINC